MNHLPLIRMVGTAPESTKQAVMTSLAAAGLGTAVDLEGTAAVARTLIVCLDADDSAALKPTYQNYTFRYVWTKTSSAEECVAACRFHLTGTNDPLEKPNAHNRFGSTRAAATDATATAVAAGSFLGVVREGLAPDGGLFMLRAIPRLPASQLKHLCCAKGLLYVEVAQTVLEMLVGDGVSPAALYPNVLLAYDASRWSGKTDICPVTPLLSGHGGLAAVTAAHATSDDDNDGGRRTAAFPLTDVAHRWMNNVSVMELYHGPTAAFKDFALQLFPRYFHTATEDEARRQQHHQHQSEQQQSESVSLADAAAAAPSTTTSALFPPKDQYVILAATSGDTGVAAISGFVNAGGHAKVMILYPMHGVSPVQQLQMLSLDDGKKVKVFGLDKNFDFCQNTVKVIFSDTALKASLAARAPAVRLSSANSINWGRLIPQVVYYFWAYRQLVQRSAVLVWTGQQPWSYGDVIDVVVPCGNFGNILAGYLAKRMGLPLRKLIVASNCNDVLYDFISTGCYDVRGRDLALTASPSIDILRASNVERLLYLLSDGDTATVSAMMGQLDTEGHFTLTSEMRSRMAETFTAGHCSEAECGETIRRVFEASGRTRVLDPHTAVAIHVAEAFRRREYLEVDLNKNHPVPPLIVAATAHWAKFPEPVLKAIHGVPMAVAEPAKTPEEAVQRVRALYKEVIACGAAAAAGGVGADGSSGGCSVEVHPALSAALDAAEGNGAQPRSAPASLAGVLAALEEFTKV